MSIKSIVYFVSVLPSLLGQDVNSYWIHVQVVHAIMMGVVGMTQIVSPAPVCPDLQVTLVRSILMTVSEVHA